MSRAYQSQFLVIVFLSGFCSLTYQITWLREFRVLFGCTSGATAAVLAVFLGGLGLGNAYFGRLFGRGRKNVLMIAALAEAIIAGLAILSPFLVDQARTFYYGLGGEDGLGYGLTTLVRIALTVLIIGGPCFLMGASFLAISERTQGEEDRGRKAISVLYSANALGGGIGVIATAFLFLEFLGNEKSLFFVGLMNLLLAAWLFWLAGKIRMGASVSADKEPSSGGDGRETGWKAAAYPVAFLSGLVFFVLELLWYRLTIPLTGGSHYSLTLILVLALAGIYLGSAFYSAFLSKGKAKGATLAVTLALQGVFVLLPYLAGETFAWYAALVTHYFSGSHFLWQVFSWCLICLPVVLPASIIAGVQFPLLVSLLGRGRDHLTNQVGAVYTLNAIGSILGALLGSFVLLPFFGADGLMLGTGVFLVVLAGGLFVLVIRKGMVAGSGQRGLLVGAALVMVLAVRADGPGALWQYSSIGFGRLSEIQKTRGEVVGLSHLYQAHLLATWEGRECSVAVSGGESPAILTNGKSDSSVHGDIATTVGSGIIPLFVFPGECEEVGIIGVGTGMTAASLVGFPEVRGVTLFEIEPAVLEAQKLFAEANGDILKHPKIEVVVGDARECLATSKKKYQLISSEPSNLGKAGICQLYTREHFEQAARSLTDDGIYAQWIQGYNLDSRSLHQVVLTMRQVFAKVELWMPAGGDLLILAYKDPDHQHRLDLLEARARSDHGRRMLWQGFLSDSVESVYGRLLARDAALVEAIPPGTRVNTDDLNSLEFRVARGGGEPGELQDHLSRYFPDFDLPLELVSQLDGGLLREERALMLWGSGRRYGLTSPELIAQAFFEQEKYREFFAVWNRLDRQSLKSRIYGAMAVASSNRPGEPFFAPLAEDCPGYALLLQGVNLFHRDQFEAGLDSVREGVEKVRERQWIDEAVGEFALKKLTGLAQFMTEDQLAALFEVFEAPLPSLAAENQRIGLVSHLATFLGDDYKLKVIRQYEGVECLPPQLVKMALECDPRPRVLEQYEELKLAGFPFGPEEKLSNTPGEGHLKK